MSGLYESLSGASGLRAEGKYAQDVAKSEAAAIRAKAKFDSIRQAKKAERVKGALTAKIAKAGGAGSPVAADLSAEQVAELELENLLIGYEGEVAAKRQESQGKLDRLRSKNAARAANVGFGMQVASLGLTGFSAFKPPAKGN
jgi:hypothetical protein